MSPIPDPLHNLELHCELCREDVRDRIAVVDRRLLALEIIVRGEDGRNGIKSQLNTLCLRFDAFEKKAIRWIAVGTALPGIVVGVLGLLRFIGKI
ncbi:MAG: hypothetical protein ACFUZC_10355 [Chthoniobacteraceae bacterium]